MLLGWVACGCEHGYVAAVAALDACSGAYLLSLVVGCMSGK